MNIFKLIISFFKSLVEKLDFLKANISMSKLSTEHYIRAALLLATAAMGYTSYHFYSENRKDHKECYDKIREAENKVIQCEKEKAIEITTIYKEQAERFKKEAEEAKKALNNLKKSQR